MQAKLLVEHPTPSGSDSRQLASQLPICDVHMDELACFTAALLSRRPDHYRCGGSAGRKATIERQ